MTVQILDIESATRPVVTRLVVRTLCLSWLQFPARFLTSYMNQGHNSSVLRRLVVR